jgi:hypothetical protein
MAKNCKISAWGCVYHACMSDHCQKSEMIKDGTSWGNGRCFKFRKNHHSDYTSEEIETLKKYYPDLPTVIIAKMLKRSVISIYGKARLLGLYKSDAFFKTDHAKRFNAKNNQKGFGSRFKEGHISFNKGKQMTDYASKDHIENFKKNSFIKGHLPHNIKSDNEITIRKTNGNLNKFIRISKSKWEFLSRYNYKKFIGEIPPGMIVAFKDKNSLNCEPENLMLLTRQQNMARNTIANYPPELVSTIHSLKKLKKHIYGKEQINRS